MRANPLATPQITRRHLPAKPVRPQPAGHGRRRIATWRVADDGARAARRDAERGYLRQPTAENPNAPFQVTPQTWAVTAQVPVTIRPNEQSPSYSQTTILPVPVVKKSFWGKMKVATKSFVNGFVLGQGEDAAGIAGDFAAGMCAWGDIRDSAGELCKLWPGGEDPDWVNFGFAAAGLATEFAPAVGEVADFFITGVKVIYKHIAKKLPMGKALVEITKEFVLKARRNGVDDALQYVERPQKLLLGMVESVNIVYVRPPPLDGPLDAPWLTVAEADVQPGDVALVPIATLQQFLDAVPRFRALGQIIKNSDDVFDYGKIVVDFGVKFKKVFGKAWKQLPEGPEPIGKDTAPLEKMLRSMNGLSSNTTTLFQIADEIPGMLDEAMKGWVVCAKSSVNPVELKQFVNIAKFDNYTTPEILADIAKFGKKNEAGDAVEGLSEMLNQTAAQLKSSRISLGRGRLYEIKCAGDLHKNPPKVKRVLERVPKDASKTDIDIETDEPGFYNAKMALTPGSWDLERDMLWIRLATDRAGDNVKNVKFIVPGGADAIGGMLSATFKGRLNDLLGDDPVLGTAWKQFFKSGPPAPVP